MAHFRLMSCPCSPQAVSFLPALPLCMSSLKFSRNEFIQASPILFMPIAFYCRAFSSPRHFTKVAGIITAGLGREGVLPRAACKPEVRLVEAQRAYRFFWTLSHRDSCSVHPSNSLLLPCLHTSVTWVSFSISVRGFLRTFRLKLLLKQCYVEAKCRISMPQQHFHGYHVCFWSLKT